MFVFDPSTYGLIVWRNGPLVGELLLKDEEGQPLDLIGQRAWMQWRDFDGGVVRLDLSTDAPTGDRLEILADDPGFLRFDVSEATLDTLPWPLIGRANNSVVLSYDLRVGPAGFEDRLFGGPVYLRTGDTSDD